MTARRADAPLASRAALAAAVGVLLVRRPPVPARPAVPGQPAAVASDPAEGDEPLLAVWDDGSVTAFCGHVDLGTGLATALAQIVAEELRIDPAAVRLLMGSTALGPNQGATIASASIQVHAEPLQRAAAQARAWLDAEAPRNADAAAPARTAAALARQASQADETAPVARRLAGRHVDLRLDLGARLVPSEVHRIVGTSLPRTDIPAKARGELVFVHDMRLPGMLHGRVVRPPYAGLDAGEFVGNTLRAVDEASVAQVDGLRAVVAIRDFVGVVAEREEDAERAMRELAVDWGDWPASPPLDDLAGALGANPSTRRVLVEHGDVDAAIAGAALPMRREYVWPYQLHGSIGPSCAVAAWHGEAAAGPALTVWAGTQNPHVLRADLALLVGLPEARVELVRMEAAGCYGRNGADDVAADAVLLARAAGAPVRVQLTREQEHLWEPKGAAQLMRVAGGLDAAGRPVGVDFSTAYPSNGAPTLALLLTRTVEPVARAFEMGDRTAVPPYAYPNLRVVAHDMAPILRASWLRGVSALPNAFAHESFVDELAAAAGADPVAFRLAHLEDPRAIELVRATAARAGWRARPSPVAGAPAAPPADDAAEPPAAPRAAESDRSLGPPAHDLRPTGDRMRGRGFAYARYLHGPFPGTGAAWAAWVAEVEVDRRTGAVRVERIVVGHDAGRMINPAGVLHQIHGNLLQTTSRALIESLPTDPATHLPAAREWGAYPILRFDELPAVVEVLTMPRQGEPPLGAGESSSVPGTAAIANAIFDATGVRLRRPPFTPEVVRAALEAAGVGGAGFDADADAPPARLPPPEPGGDDAVPVARDDPGSDGVAGFAGAPPARGPRVADVDVDVDASVEAEAANANANATAAEAEAGAAAGAAAAAAAPWPRRRPLWRRLGWLASAAVGALAAIVGRGPAPIATVAAPASGVYTAATIEAGGRLVAAGACAVCHTAPGGLPNAGGRALATPFGTVWSTNLTPDPASGLGGWSLGAFERAMREGVSRDGHRLYPAFPYTAYTHLVDADLTAIYAYLMAQPPVVASVPTTRLAFPFGARPLLGLWNALFLDPGPVASVGPPAQVAPLVPLAQVARVTPGSPVVRVAPLTTVAPVTPVTTVAPLTTVTRVAPGSPLVPVTPFADRAAALQRGAYLVDGLGHCGACHTPRNAFGAERSGRAYLAGAVVDGWDAPALSGRGLSPLRWTETDFFDYLRHGHSDRHGSAAGPMAPVVRGLGALSDTDIRAMAAHLASFVAPDEVGTGAVARPAARPDAPPAAPLPGPAARLFTAACGACHHDGDGPRLLGLNIPLSLNTNLHADRPDNLLRTIQDGIRAPSTADQGFMPAFGDALDDRQVAELAAYLRARFAPARPAWPELRAASARVRATRSPN